MKKILIYTAIFILSCIMVFGILYKKVSKLEYTPVQPQYDLDIEKVVIGQGDVLALTFSKTKLSRQDYSEILSELKKNVNINRCMPGDFYEIVYSPENGQWTHFWYYPSGAEFCSIKKSSEGVVFSEKKSLSTATEIFRASGTIDSSLWESMSSAGTPADIILLFADIFAWQMDFLTDTRKGDAFKVIYEIEQITKKNTRLSSNILAAQYTSGSKVYNAFLYKKSNGESGYFDEEGKSVKSAFLKAPLQFRRISSHFTTSRKHPILKYARPHLGIDYAAPSGTPVSTIGDGVVTKSQYSGGFGNYVEVKHANGYVSSYGHLLKYGRGIKRGVRVKQGQVIGYVGSTGLSTGPHLDFRIKKDGKFFNYLTMKQPPVTTLKGEEKKEFLQYADKLLEEFGEKE